jgi:hypothetical protein
MRGKEKAPAVRPGLVLTTIGDPLVGTRREECSAMVAGGGAVSPFVGAALRRGPR